MDHASQRSHWISSRGHYKSKFISIHMAQHLYTNRYTMRLVENAVSVPKILLSVRTWGIRAKEMIVNFMKIWNGARQKKILQIGFHSRSNLLSLYTKKPSSSLPVYNMCLFYFLSPCYPWANTQRVIHCFIQRFTPARNFDYAAARTRHLSLSSVAKQFLFQFHYVIIQFLVFVWNILLCMEFSSFLIRFDLNRYC